MNETPKGNRLHIGVYGRRNAGKSSLINAMLGQDLAIVSDVPGTTTDPVEKAYELQPFGPVLFIDTAGIDDTGELGQKRILKTKEALKRTDLALLVISGNKFGEFEEGLAESIMKSGIKWALIFNKADEAEADVQLSGNLTRKYSVPAYSVSALKKTGIENLKNSLAENLGKEIPDPPILADLISSGQTIVLVVPIDKEAPKGRLILPQVQTIREILDCDANAVVVKERELSHVYSNVLRDRPALVVTDSQAFLKVDADTPADIPMTSFSILFARQKGDLAAYAEGLKAIDRLKDNDRVLISEQCSHHAIADDIGRVKIPRWLTNYTGRNLIFDSVSGRDYPQDLSPYSLAIQCGGCMVNRRSILSRIADAQGQNVPITNYGMIIAHMHGILERALKPFGLS